MTTPKDEKNQISPKRLKYRRHQRLSGKKAYSHVFNNGQRRTSGPLTIFAAVNKQAYPRLGLSVSRKVGNAVIRSRLKRRIREAFRHLQHEFKIGCDYIVVCRKHELMPMQDYQRLMYGAMRHHQQKIESSRVAEENEKKSSIQENT